MDHLDDLPKRHKNHVTESQAESAFQKLLALSNDFFLQASDRKDYGTDCHIEVVSRDNATNVRIQVQLKGTEKAENADGSICIEIQRANLNYLLMQPHSSFVCYHVPTQKLRVCTVDAVLRQYMHSGQSWTQQKTLTVNFSEVLTETWLRSLAVLARSSAASLRNIRIAQTTARPEDLPKVVKTTHLPLNFPQEITLTAEILSSLYENDADDIISAEFEKFAEILGRESESPLVSQTSRTAAKGPGCVKTQVNTSSSERSWRTLSIQQI